MKKTIAAWVLGFLGSTPIMAQAATLSANIAVSDTFTMYLSTEDGNGGQVGYGDDWEVTYAFDNIPLVAGVKNYINIAAVNWGDAAGFLGDFSLSDAGFAFANGTQKLTTGIFGWEASVQQAIVPMMMCSLQEENLNFFGGVPAIVTVIGQNGDDPWGLRPSIDNAASWIWAGSGRFSEKYFSAEIIPISSPASVPEPATAFLLGTGLVGVSYAGLKRRRK